MANGLLRRIAIVAGTGLAMGMSTRPRQVGAPALPPAPPTPPEHFPEPDNFLDLEPLLDRLESLESRLDWLSRLEAKLESLSRAPRISAPVEKPADNSAELIAALTERIAHLEQNQPKAAPTTDELRELIEQAVNARLAAIDPKLADHSGSLETLRSRLAETDANLQRLVSAIEKLCERAQLIPPTPPVDPAARFAAALPPRVKLPEPPPPAPRPPFESQLLDAMRREPVVPKLRTEEPAPEPPVIEVRQAEVEVTPPAFGSAPAAPPKKRFLFRNRS